MKKMSCCSKHVKWLDNHEKVIDWGGWLLLFSSVFTAFVHYWRPEEVPITLFIPAVAAFALLFRPRWRSFKK